MAMESGGAAGLSDCHIHIALDGANYKNAVAGGYSPDSVRSKLEAYRGLGFAFLRDGGDNVGASLYAHDAAAEYGIDYRTPAFAIFRQGLYGGIVGRPFSSLKELGSLIRQAARLGCDCIKIMVSGIMDFSERGRLTPGRLSREEIRYAANAAHGEGLAVMAHANGDEAIVDCAECGVDSVEHGYYIQDGGIRALADAGCLWVPTLAPVSCLVGSGAFPDASLNEILEGQLEAVAKAAAIGVRLACGSDAGASRVFHGEGSLAEMRLMRRALGSFEPLEAGAKWAMERF
jgi:imidazolonepropionase-like amidohydrolase